MEVFIPRSNLVIFEKKEPWEWMWQIEQISSCFMFLSFITRKSVVFKKKQEEEEGGVENALMNLVGSDGIQSRMKELWVFIWLVWNKTPNYDTSSEGPSWICNLYTKLKGLTSLLTSNWYPNFLRTTTPRNLGYESSPNTCIEPWGGWWCTRYMVKRESGSKWTFPILLWLGGLGHEVIKKLVF